MADDAPKIADFLNALEAAQQDGYTHKETKEAANGIDIETLKLAFDKVSEQDEKAELDVESELEALKKGFDFAVELVKTLKKQPGMTDKGVLYGYYKCERGEDVAQPQTRRLFDPVGHGKYEYWLEASKNTKIKVQQLYIEKVNELIIKHGLQ